MFALHAAEVQVPPRWAAGVPPLHASRGPLPLGKGQAAGFHWHGRELFAAFRHPCTSIWCTPVQSLRAFWLASAQNRLHKLGMQSALYRLAGLFSSQLFCGDQKTLLTLQMTMQQHRAWPNRLQSCPTMV